MKKMLPHGLPLAAIFACNSLQAQCDLKVKITPSNPILCPQSTDTLSTTEEYDSYQWYRGNDPIPGATGRNFVVDESNIGHRYKVVVSERRCTDTSKKVYVDGWAFLPPYLILSEDIEKFDPRKEAFILCPKDTILMTMGLPYSQNIQWYNRGKPIPGANSTDYAVTKTGSYTACGAPEICPNYIACVGIPTNVWVENPKVEITERDDTLFATGGRNFKWFVNKHEIPGANENYVVPRVSGRYVAGTRDQYGCTAISDPYTYRKENNQKPITVSPNPVKDVLKLKISSSEVAQTIIFDFNGNVKMKQRWYNTDATLDVRSLQPGSYVLRGIDKSGKRVASVIFIKQ